MSERKIKRSLRSLLSLFIVTALLLSMMPLHTEAYEKHNLLENLNFYVNGSSPVKVKTIHYYYENNRYVSMRDVAAALRGTEKRYEMGVNGREISLTTNTDYVAAGGENEPFTLPEVFDSEFYYETNNLRYNDFLINGENVRYYTFLAPNGAGVTDVFISVTDLAMMLDLNLQFDAGGLHVSTAESLVIDMADLSQKGFFTEVQSALVGDASTGVIYASSREDLSVPIASTTKLMTYLCVMDAVRDGAVHMGDVVMISEDVSRLSYSSDGLIRMEIGDQVSLRELLIGMLLPSSNECALALAEYVAGSEAKFVERMNAKAAALGLSDQAYFYNCNGLPTFVDSTAATKVQNHMTATDMFVLASHILNVYPEVREITSIKKTVLEAWNVEVKNSNPLLYNLKECVGLKTGTTNMSGACLVSVIDVTGPDGAVHPIVSIEFGAEDSATRSTFSQELLLYGKQELLSGNTEGQGAMAIPGDEINEIVIPSTAEGLVRLVLEEAGK